ncbi:Uncharacterised protein, partial [uncultured Comamonas sp.]
MATSITQEQLMVVKSYAEAGDYKAGWKYLASIGDNYADNAYVVTTGDSDGLVDRLMHRLVKNYWDAVAGSGEYHRKFDGVAKQHFSQYVKIIDDNKGILPNSRDIEDSYRSAVTDYNLPPNTAIDGAITQSFGEILDRLWPGEKHEGLDWTDALGMEDSRQVPSDVNNDIDFIQSLKDLMGSGWDSFWAQVEKDTLDTIVKFSRFLNKVDDEINDIVKSTFDIFTRFPQRSDPFTLDLDGDGLETVGINTSNPVMFDIDAMGVKQSVGWVSPDDGFLTLDRNGNGTIDDGAELFGDATVLPNGNRAKDGFEAVASLDTNGDGVVNALDAQWAELRIWQDLNQDGISQADELKALETLGIIGINVAKTEHEKVLGNGNVLADLGTFIRTDGTDGTTGTVGQLADIDLSVDSFTSQFTDKIAVTEQAASLPDMGGSGQVRDLQQAASMDTTAGRALANILAQYSAATTRQEQMALLEPLIDAWAKTSTMATTFTGAYAGHELTVDMQVWFGGAGFEKGAADYVHWANILTIMERFNGRTYQAVPEGNDPVTLTLWHTPRGLLQKSYDALKQSVYDSLLLQTRLKPYLDALSLRIDGQGLTIDFAEVNAAFQTRFTSAPAEAVRDLLDLQRLIGTNLDSLGWQGYDQLRGWLHSAAGDTAQQTALLGALKDFGYISLGLQGQGGSGADVVLGVDTGATLQGGEGNDLLLGGAGDDVLEGGRGDDTLVGGAGNDTYVLRQGGGHDTVVETHGQQGQDTLQLADIQVGDLNIGLAGDDLLLTHTNGKDSIRVQNWAGAFDEAAHRLDSLQTADGRNYDLGAIQLAGAESATLQGGAGNDVLVGGAGSDTLLGGAGDDILHGGAGADRMEGGTGNDTYVVDDAGDTVVEQANEGIDTVQSRISYTLGEHVENLILAGSSNIDGIGNALDNILTGNSGHNRLYGGAGNDTLLGGAGNDLLNGGTGADRMEGGTGNDSYVVDDAGDVVVERAGEGVDTVEASISYTLGDNV